MRQIGLLAILLVGFTMSGTGQIEDRSKYTMFFEQAAEEFDVPVDVLKGIAFAETRWSHLVWSEGDTASPCNGMPRPFGIMSLWDNQYFGQSLREAAKLIGRDPSELKRDVLQNMRGAAALLRTLYDSLPKPAGTVRGVIESWRNAIASYSGLPQAELAQQHALDIYTHMTRGYHQYGIEWDARAVNLEPIRDAVRRIQAEAEARRKKEPDRPLDQPDYPGAKWASAYPGHWYTSGYGLYFVVVHDMEGYYLSTISYFQQSSTQASAHYCINGLKDNSGDAPAGEITQMVEEKYWAWHVRCWNRYMLGIEHEGFVSNPAWYTDEMYKSSAELTAYLCNKYKIPKDRNHIIGHSEWQNASWQNWVNTVFNPQYGYSLDPTCNDHTDPGVNWKWSYYMALVTQEDTVAPVVATSYPQPNDSLVPAYKDIVVKFNVAMDVGPTNAAFTLSPAVPGAKSWSGDSKTLTFHPTSFLAFQTTYVVRIDSSAKNISLKRNIDGNGDGVGGDPYEFAFTTVAVDTIGPVVIRSYPHINEENVSTTAEVFVTVDEPLQSASLAGRVQLLDSAGGSVSYTSGKYATVEERGVISFVPSALRYGSLYTAKILSGINDLYGNSSVSDIVVPFRTTAEVVAQGTIFDDFESNTRAWIQPIGASGTTGVDSGATYWGLSSDRKKRGNYAGRLAYRFSQTGGGVVVEQATSSPPIDQFSTLGIWINGDDSGNRLDARFLPDNQVVSMGDITWRGWKFVQMHLDTVIGSGKKFSAFLLRQNPSGGRSGVLFFDDMQLDAIITRAPDQVATAAGQFVLNQNYPNPFNPTTVISYRLAVKSFVSLKIYDVLGREVATLVNEEHPAGSYTVQWNAADMPSGVYFYRLDAGSFSETRKVLLLK